MAEAAHIQEASPAGVNLIFEIDETGRILKASGAASVFAPADVAALTGRRAVQLFADSDAEQFAALAETLVRGGGAQLARLRLIAGGSALVSLRRQPDGSGRISCALSCEARPAPVAVETAPSPAADPPSDLDLFIAQAAASADGDGALALVDMPNFLTLVRRLPPAVARSVLTRFQARVRAEGHGAARLSDTRYGVLAGSRLEASGIAKRVHAAAQDCGLKGLQVEATLVSLKARGLKPEQSVLAVRHVLDTFMTGAPGAKAPGDLAQAFDAMITKTIERATKFAATVAEGAFDLALEPIVDLETLVPMHHEALTRFAPGESPAETIRFAEEMRIADAFDLAVAVKVLAELEREPQGRFKLALNVSGRTIASPESFALLEGLLARKSALAPRLLIEITETAAIPDLPAANALIQRLRGLGCRVGLDDFGAGAASLQYLHAFAVDFVKIDGSLIQRLGKSARDDALLKGVLGMCTELGIDVIAEWIDSPEKLTRARALGFRLGQGRLFAQRGGL